MERILLYLLESTDPSHLKDVVGQRSYYKHFRKCYRKKSSWHRHYYLLGPRGVGKTTCARILGKKNQSRDDS